MDNEERKRLWRQGRDKIQEASRELHARLAQANPHLFPNLPPPVVTPDPLSADRQRFMEESIRLARAKGLAARGTAKFELIIPIEHAAWKVLPLGEVFLQPNAKSVIAAQIKDIHKRIEQDRELAKRFISTRLRTEAVPGESAIESWTHHAARFSETGVYPVMLASDLTKSELNSRLSSAAHVYDDEVGSAEQLDIENWFVERRREYEEDGWLTDDILVAATVENMNKGQISTHKTANGQEVRKKVTLTLLAVQQPWQVMIMLQFGGFNDAPEPAQQAALFRYWQEKYGVQIAGVGSDTVECVVQNPPDTLAAATHLAWEQFLFCPSIVDQGCGTVGRLAEVLVNSPYWFFWWD